VKGWNSDDDGAECTNSAITGSRGWSIPIFNFGAAVPTCADTTAGRMINSMSLG